MQDVPHEQHPWHDPRYAAAGRALGTRLLMPGLPVAPSAPPTVAFAADHAAFLVARAIPPAACFIAGAHLNLFALARLVLARGGMAQVIADRALAAVRDDLAIPPTATGAASLICHYYAGQLLAYEQALVALEDPPPPATSASASAHAWPRTRPLGRGATAAALVVAATMRAASRAGTAAADDADAALANATASAPPAVAAKRRRTAAAPAPAPAAATREVAPRPALLAPRPALLAPRPTLLVPRPALLAPRPAQRARREAGGDGGRASQSGTAAAVKEGAVKVARKPAAAGKALPVPTREEVDVAAEADRLRWVHPAGSRQVRTYLLPPRVARSSLCRPPPRGR
jgi:hypothetical protein